MASLELCQLEFAHQLRACAKGSLMMRFSAFSPWDQARVGAGRVQLPPHGGASIAADRGSVIALAVLLESPSPGCH